MVTQIMSDFFITQQKTGIAQPRFLSALPYLTFGKVFWFQICYIEACTGGFATRRVPVGVAVYRPWNLIYTERFDSKNEATKREWYLKHPKGYLEKKALIEQYRLIGGFA